MLLVAGFLKSDDKAVHTTILVSGLLHPRIPPTGRLLHLLQVSSVFQILNSKQKVSISVQKMGILDRTDVQLFSYKNTYPEH